MKKVSQLSVFFPAYNEEDNIKATVLNAKKVLQQVAREWEIVVVDDGSKDKTREIVFNLSKKDHRIRLVAHQKNRGYGGALKTGIYNCKYKLIAFTDSDGQFNFSEVKKFLPKLKKNDLVIGFRKKRTDSFYRRLMARALWLADLILFGLNVRDVDCGFKVFKKEVREKIGKLVTESAITETEFVVRAKKAGFKIAEVGVTHNVRTEGIQTGGKFSVIFKAGIEGLKLWLILLKENS